MNSLTKPHNWNFKMYYDGACPICSREVRFLMRRNKRATLIFEDTSKPEFDREAAGLPNTSERIIHGKLPSGKLVSGVEVFRRAYHEVGLGWLLAPTAWPVIKPIADAAYYVFSKNRARISRLFGKPCDTACEFK